MSTIKTNTDDDGIMTITLNRPDKLNALNRDVLVGLSEILSQAAENSAVKALLITGEAKAFCAGADINQLACANAEQGYQMARFGQQVFRQLETLGKPSLAAVNGFAFGGGCELAISASMRIASQKAQFGQPEVKLGVIPGYGGTQRLARLVGKGRALDLCLTGRFIGAEEACAWGLVNEVVDADSLLERAHAILKQVIALAPLAIRGVLETIDKGYDMSLDDALHLEAVQFAMTCATEDKNIGTQAFLNKKAAQFRGE